MDFISDECEGHGRSKERREDGLGVNEPKVVMGQQYKADFRVIIVIFVYHDT